ncbi:MAG: DNA starvation/stationary phase protection protein [Pseudomonadota bacterium]
MATTAKQSSKKSKNDAAKALANAANGFKKNVADDSTVPSPHLYQNAKEIQQFDEVVALPNGLSVDICSDSIGLLNQLLADTMTLRDMYKKHHWQVVGPTFGQLHELYDKHYNEQAALVDIIAERIQLLGGLSVAMAADVAEMTNIERPPRGREEAPVQLSRLLAAHEMIMKQARSGSEKASDAGDPGTEDVMVSDVLRTNELQSWFLSEHLVNTRLVDAR